MIILSLIHTETQIQLPVAAVDRCGRKNRHDEAKTPLPRPVFLNRRAARGLRKLQYATRFH